jgi:hypothetical protein
VAELIPALDALRTEFNLRAPGRDKASDGWIGDASHSARDSDHNPDSRGLVHAVDVDEDLRVPGLTMAECVAHIVGRHRRGLDNRLTYVIYERTIWSASRDWQPRAYDGSNPHDKHAHFSARRWPAIVSRERDRRSWGISTLGVPAVTSPTPASIADAVWDETTTIPGTSPAQTRSMRDLVRYLYSKESIAARVVELLATGEGTALYELAQEVQKIRDDLQVLMSDPADTADPEGHPFVMAARYVAANPPPGA